MSSPNASKRKNTGTPDADAHVDVDPNDVQKNIKRACLRPSGTDDHSPGEEVAESTQAEASEASDASEDLEEAMNAPCPNDAEAEEAEGEGDEDEDEGEGESAHQENAGMEGAGVDEPQDHNSLAPQGSGSGGDVSAIDAFVEDSRLSFENMPVADVRLTARMKSGKLNLYASTGNSPVTDRGLFSSWGTVLYKSPPQGDFQNPHTKWPPADLNAAKRKVVMTFDPESPTDMAFVKWCEALDAKILNWHFSCDLVRQEYTNAMIKKLKCELNEAEAMGRRQFNSIVKRHDDGTITITFRAYVASTFADTYPRLRNAVRRKASIAEDQEATAEMRARFPDENFPFFRYMRIIEVDAASKLAVIPFERNTINAGDRGVIRFKVKPYLGGVTLETQQFIRSMDADAGDGDGLNDL